LLGEAANLMPEQFSALRETERYVAWALLEL
jgi:hypothetical protein